MGKTESFTHITFMKERTNLLSAHNKGAHIAFILNDQE
jgi:hypothetical protein